MDAYEATKAVFSRIQRLDPENASKIMGLLLIQDDGDKEMIRLAFGPDNLLHSLVVKGRHDLGISPNTPSVSGSRFLTNGLKLPSPLSIPTLVSPSSSSLNNNIVSKSGLNPSSPPFYGGDGRPKSSDVVYTRRSELLGNNGVGDSMLFSSGVSNAEKEKWGGGFDHRRSCSVSDVNSSAAAAVGCRFVPGVGSPRSKLEAMEKCPQLMRSKSMQHHNNLMGYSINEGLGSFHQNHYSSRAIALMMEEDLQKFSRSPRGLDHCRGDSNHASKQIYLTFPADSTFREEDVSSYFSIYGPVEDVRIPYQQKRMFGFVTFVFPDTVKIILAKGNPHFVCDSRVLVKPYKEKGKVPDKFRKNQQQMERGYFSSCGSPTSIDSRDPFDLPPGARMMYDTQTQYMLWKRKLEEEADLQQALELQSKRLMSLQLLDIKLNHHHRSFSTGVPSVPSPTQSPNSIFHQALIGSDRSSPDASDEMCERPPPDVAKEALQQAVNEVTDIEKESSVGGEDTNNVNGIGSPCRQDNDFNFAESILEHNLPESPFASPEKERDGGSSEVEVMPISSANSTNNNSNISPFLPSSPALDMASFQSCYFQMPRFSHEHGAIGM